MPRETAVTQWSETVTTYTTSSSGEFRATIPVGPINLNVGFGLPASLALFGMLFQLAMGFFVLPITSYVYRSGRVAWNHIITRPNLPAAYYAGGNFTTNCTLIQDPISADIHSCEDITFWDHHTNGALTDRLLLLGCDPNRKAWNTVMGPLRDPNPRGHLFLYVPATHDVHRLTLEGYPPTHDFHPLGLAIAPTHDGTPSSLFVVNHARTHTTIEQFELDPARLSEARYRRTLRVPGFVSPNALAITGPNSFFVSNDHWMTRRLPSPFGHVLPVVESIAGLPFGWVAHVQVHDGDNAEATFTHTVVARRIPFANGLAISPDRAHLAVSATSIGRVYVYRIRNATAPNAAPSLKYTHAIDVPFFPDNLAYDDDGALIVAGHPHFPSLIAVAANRTGAIAPSHAVSVAPSEGKHAGKVETLFRSDGSVFGTSSTTLRDARTGAIYVAGLYEEGVLVCKP